tara:strand:+ start:505 stop:1224 length:720 start_codon:yes stop_codon:yes gene_type:complete
MPTEWVMDKNYEWEQIAIPEKAKRRPNEVTKPLIKKKGKDAQKNMKGFCACGRPNGTKNSYRRDPTYCSRYCFEFMTFPAEGYKKKTRYDFWRGTGKYAYNPPWPKLEASCAWCNDTFTLKRSDENRLFCGQGCSHQAKRNPKSTSKRNGSTQIALRVRTMIILRAFPNEDLSSDEIATHYRDWFRMSCSAAKISSSIKTLIKNKWVTKFDGGRVFTYTINDTKTPLKSLFGEKDNLGR